MSSLLEHTFDKSKVRMGPIQSVVSLICFTASRRRILDEDEPSASTEECFNALKYAQVPWFSRYTEINKMGTPRIKDPSPEKC